MRRSACRALRRMRRAWGGRRAHFFFGGNTGPRPETFDQDACFGLLADLLAERGLLRATLGVDLDFMPAADFARLKSLLPDVDWRDASGVLRRVRVTKKPPGIARGGGAAARARGGRVKNAQTGAPRPRAVHFFRP